MAHNFLDTNIPHISGIYMTTISISSDISRFITKETLRSFMRPSTSTGWELKPHTLLYLQVMLRFNCFITFSGMMFVEAPESNMQLCNRRSLIAKVSRNGSCPRFRSGRWIFCNATGNSSSSNPRDFLTYHCCRGSFTISFNGTYTVIFSIEVSKSISSSTSLPLFLFVGSFFCGSFLGLTFFGGSLRRGSL